MNGVVSGPAVPRDLAALTDIYNHYVIHYETTVEASIYRSPSAVGRGTFTGNGRKFGRYWDVAWFERPLMLTI